MRTAAPRSCSSATKQLEGDAPTRGQPVNVACGGSSGAKSERQESSECREGSARGAPFDAEWQHSKRVCRCCCYFVFVFVFFCALPSYRGEEFFHSFTRLQPTTSASAAFNACNLNSPRGAHRCSLCQSRSRHRLRSNRTALRAALLLTASAVHCHLLSGSLTSAHQVRSICPHPSTTQPSLPRVRERLSSPSPQLLLQLLSLRLCFGSRCFCFLFRHG